MPGGSSGSFPGCGVKGSGAPGVKRAGSTRMTVAPCRIWSVAWVTGAIVISPPAAGMRSRRRALCVAGRHAGREHRREHEERRPESTVAGDQVDEGRRGDARAEADPLAARQPREQPQDHRHGQERRDAGQRQPRTGGGAGRCRRSQAPRRYRAAEVERQRRHVRQDGEALERARKSPARARAPSGERWPPAACGGWGARRRAPAADTRPAPARTRGAAPPASCRPGSRTSRSPRRPAAAPGPSRRRPRPPRRPAASTRVRAPGRGCPAPRPGARCRAR